MGNKKRRVTQVHSPILPDLTYLIHLPPFLISNLQEVVGPLLTPSRSTHFIRQVAANQVAYHPPTSDRPLPCCWRCPQSKRAKRKGNSHFRSYHSSSHSHPITHTSSNHTLIVSHCDHYQKSTSQTQAAHPPVPLHFPFVPCLPPTLDLTIRQSPTQPATNNFFFFF